MSGSKSNENVTTASTSIRQPRQRMAPNYLLIW
ncbi:unnamed protein product, partial [Adineta steineri]